MTRFSSRHLALVATAALVAVAATGCGGSSPLAQSAPTSSPQTSPATASPATTPATATPATTAPAATTPAAPTTETPTSPTTAPSTAAPTTAPDSAQAQALLNTARSDALAQKWAHVSGTELVTVAGPDRGTQTVKVGAYSGSIRVLPNTTYIQGSALAIEHLFGVPAAAAKKVAGKWVILTHADSEYKSVTIGVTLPSELSAIALTGTLRAEAYNQEGKHGTLISGSLPAAAGVPKGLGALLITSGSHPLPEEFAEFQSSGATAEDETFSLWGAGELVKAPTGAVPLPAAGGGTVS